MSLLDEVAAEVRDDPGSLGLILHGSRATGVHGPESDYDLLDTGDPSFQQQLELRVEALMESRGIEHQWGPEDDLEPVKALRFAEASA